MQLRHRKAEGKMVKMRKLTIEEDYGVYQGGDTWIIEDVKIGNAKFPVNIFLSLGGDSGDSISLYVTDPDLKFSDEIDSWMDFDVTNSDRNALRKFLKALKA